MKKIFMALVTVLMMSFVISNANAEITIINQTGVSGTIGIMNGKVNNFGNVNGDIEIRGNGDVVISSNDIADDTYELTSPKISFKVEWKRNNIRERLEYRGEMFKERCMLFVERLQWKMNLIKNRVERLINYCFQ